MKIFFTVFLLLNLLAFFITVSELTNQEFPHNKKVTRTDKIVSLLAFANWSFWAYYFLANSF